MEIKYPVNQRIREVMAFFGYSDNVDGFYKKYIGDGPSERLRTVYKDSNLIKLDFLLEITEKIGLKELKKVDLNWLLTGEGQMFFTEKGTGMEKTDNNENDRVPEEVYKNLVESNSEYRLMPKVVLDDYEIVSKVERDTRNQRIQDLIASKNELLKERSDTIKELRREIEDLKAKLIAIPIQPRQ